MGRIAYWVVRMLVWAPVLCLIHLGAVLYVLAPTIGPRGDLDNDGFSESRKRPADLEAMITQLSAIIPLAVAGLLAFFDRRIAAAVTGSFGKGRS